MRAPIVIAASLAGLVAGVVAARAADLPLRSSGDERLLLRKLRRCRAGGHPRRPARRGPAPLVAAALAQPSLLPARRGEIKDRPPPSHRSRAGRAGRKVTRAIGPIRRSICSTRRRCCGANSCRRRGAITGVRRACRPNREDPLLPVKAMSRIVCRLAIVVLCAAGLAPVSAAQAQWYGTVASRQPPPLYPYELQPGQSYAVEVAPGTYVIHHPSRRRAYPGASRRSEPVARRHHAAPKLRPKRTHADRALIEELRRRDAKRDCKARRKEAARKAAGTGTRAGNPTVIHTRRDRARQAAGDRNPARGRGSAQGDHAPPLRRRRAAAARAGTSPAPGPSAAATRIRA